jgi:hypothetical protein
MGTSLYFVGLCLSIEYAELQPNPVKTGQKTGGLPLQPNPVRLAALTA